MKILGIYKIQSIVKPERVYIGSSINIKQRWSNHLSRLNFNKHINPKLQHHFNKYGIKDLQFSIISECDVKQLITIEQYFLDFYDPYFNVCKVAGPHIYEKCQKRIKIIKLPKKRGRKPMSEEERYNKDKERENKLSLKKEYYSNILLYKDFSSFLKSIKRIGKKRYHKPIIKIRKIYKNELVFGIKFKYGLLSTI